MLVVPKAKKFQKDGIDPDFEATLLDRMFRQTVATGEDAWTPSSGLVPSPNENDTQSEDSEDSDKEPKDTNKKRKRENASNGNTNKKERGWCTKLSHQIDRLCEAVERRSSTKIDTLGPSITLAIEHLDTLPSSDPMGETYMFATRRFMNKDKREKFINALKQPEVKLARLMSEKNEQDKENNLISKIL